MIAETSHVGRPLYTLRLFFAFMQISPSTPSVVETIPAAFLFIPEIPLPMERERNLSFTVCAHPVANLLFNQQDYKPNDSICCLDNPVHSIIMFSSMHFSFIFLATSSISLLGTGEGKKVSDK